MVLEYAHVPSQEEASGIVCTGNVGLSEEAVARELLRRKKLLFRCWHRGMREMDLILGPFAEAKLFAMSEQVLDQFEYFINQADQDLLGWIMGQNPLPPEIEALGFIAQLRLFHSVLARREGGSGGGDQA